MPEAERWVRLGSRRVWASLVGGVVALGAPLALGQADYLANLAADDRALEPRLSPRERLGKQLFEDPRLSTPAGQSCASCHDVRHGFTDGRRLGPTSAGALGHLFGNRNTPSAGYMAFSPPFHFDKEEKHYVGGQFWDGRAHTLEEQARGPFLNPLEMANAHGGEVVAKLRQADYAPLFAEVFGPTALADENKAYIQLSEAIAAYERSAHFNRFTSKYDAWLAGKAQLTAAERRGLQLFERTDKGNCAACHPVAPERGSFGQRRGGLGTDFTYDNLGVPRNPANPFYGLDAHNPHGKGWVDRGLGAVVGQASEDGKFKVPTVRNAAVSAPYMHNGYFQTLRGLVDFYATRDTKPRCADPLTPEADALRQGCWPAPEVAANVNTEELGNLKLKPSEIDDIVAFMEALTDGYVRAEALHGKRGR